MKTNCAWCGRTISVSCDHCHAQMIRSDILGGTFTLFGQAYVCLTGETPIVTTDAAVQQMKTSHGLCEQCSRLPSTERDALLTQRRLADPRLPSAADLDAIAEEHRIREATEKRGPTRVTRRATPHNPDVDAEREGRR